MYPRILAVLFASFTLVSAAELRVGMIGLDTSHVVVFARALNDPTARDHVPGARVVAAFPGGSPDLPASADRVGEYTRELREKYGVQMFDSIEEMCRHVDVVLLHSVDGRPHLAQIVPVLAARKPVFIDKPVAASLRDAIEIYERARRARVPVFSSSALRFATNTLAARHGAIGRVWHAQTTSPCPLEPHHPDLFWYGIHGVESLFTVMGTGIETVQRGHTPDGRIEVLGRWKGGRFGIYREDKTYGGRAWGAKGEMPVGQYDGYGTLIAEVMKFFRSGIAPVSPAETLEIVAFMEAADESKRRSGAPVAVRDVMRAAQQTVRR